MRHLGTLGREVAVVSTPVTVLHFKSACAPLLRRHRRRHQIAKEELKVKLLPVTQVAKLDAGLSCMSLR